VVVLATVLASGCTTDIAAVECAAGVGAPPQAGCSGARLDCNCSADDGCEVDSLRDATHCGRCGHDCGGGACVDGACMPVTVAQLDGRAAAMQLAGPAVFVSLRTSIVRVDVATGAVVTSTTTEEDPVFAVDETHVYWAGDEADGALRRVPLAGGAAEVLAPVTNAGGLALDEQAVFLTDHDHVTSVPKAGGAAKDLGLFINALHGIAVDDADAFFFRDTDLGSLTRVAKSGASSAELIWGKAIEDLVIDEQRAYVALRDEGPYAIDKTGTLGALLASRPGVGALAVDATDVYFSTDDGLVLRVAKSGGEPVTVAADQATIVDVAVDDAGVYWLRSGADSAELVRVSK
jgi:hypothetical protein